MDEVYEAFTSDDGPLWVEHRVESIISRQEKYGVLFNQRKARRCIKVLERRQGRLYDCIRPSLSYEVVRPYGVPINAPFLKDGSYSSNTIKWWGEADVHQVGGPHSRVSFEQPDLGKRGKIQAQLLKLGWIPRSYTDKGSPRIVVEGEPCESLLAIDDQLGKQLSMWYIYNHRRGQIQGWLDRVRPDGRLSAGANTQGAVTYRMTHRNVVNVPKAKKKVPFGWHMRSLFTVPKGKVMVGYDASGLELRLLADATKDEAYIHEVTHGDIHTKNQRDAGLPDRDDAKTFIYAFIYGAGDGKLGSIVGGTEHTGRSLRARFLEANPALREAIENTKRAAQRGYLIGLDSRHIHLRRDKDSGEIHIHKALNTRLQSAGALVMKWAMVIMDLWVRQLGLDAHKVIDMHDEAQWECWPKDAHTIGRLGVESIKAAGKLLGLACPLDGEYKIGRNWAMTH